MENTELLLTAQSNRFDTRKVLNRAGHVTIPPAFIAELESDGLTSESLDSFKLPIFKYQTQITLHGLFPEREMARIGGYKSAFVNQNGSLGVRYNAVDYAKKHRLAEALTPCHWTYQRDSKGDAYVYQAKNESDARALYAQIDVSRFYASKQLMVARFLGIYYVVVYVRALYEADFWPLFTAISGKTPQEGKAALDSYRAQVAEKENERKIRYAESALKDKQEAAINAERLQTELIPQLSHLPEWNKEFVPDIVLVGTVLNYSDKPRFAIYQLAKKGGWFQFVGNSALKLTDTPYVNAYKQDRHSFKTVPDLLRAIKGKSTIPFRVLSSPSIARPSGLSQSGDVRSGPASLSVGGAGVTIRENKAMRGIEVLFARQPDESTKIALKGLGYAWSKKGLWYTKFNPNTLAQTQQLLLPPVIVSLPTTESFSGKATARLTLLKLKLQLLYV